MGSDGKNQRDFKEYFKEENDKKVKDFMNSLGLKQDENTENDLLYQSILNLINH